MAFICGFPHSQVEDDYDVLWPYPSKKPAARSRRNKNTTNPYADRGLDKFEALLADLDHKRQEILTQKGSEDVNMVKFVYRSPDEVKPIVVKLRKHHKTSPPEDLVHQKDAPAFVKDGSESEQGKRAKKIRFDEWRRKIGKPWNYFPLFLIFILVLLMFSGRSFAILCTSFGWYMVPIINHNSKQQIKKRKLLKESRRTDKQSAS